MNDYDLLDPMAFTRTSGGAGGAFITEEDWKAAFTRTSGGAGCVFLTEDWKARAEKAEARVKELEREIELRDQAWPACPT